MKLTRAKIIAELAGKIVGDMVDLPDGDYELDQFEYKVKSYFLTGKFHKKEKK